jgi:hypothetical protein
MDTAQDPEVIDRPAALELRRPSVPTTLNDLAALKGEGIEIIEARQTILETARRAAIRMTTESDWVLYKAPDGQITGYLQDCGADRVRDLLGIEIHSVSEPLKVQGDQPGVFHYLIRGSGRCKMTRQELEEIEGGRSSGDDFCKNKAGVELELAVRKAARANLDGNITRELAGLKSVQVEEIAAAWEGTKKKVERCHKGRGFGSGVERHGGQNENVPDIEPPRCAHCNTPGVFKSSNDGGYYYCPNFKAHQQKRWNINAKKWAEDHAAANKAPSASAAGTTPDTGRREAPMTADEIFSRTPGSEG